MGNKVNPVYTKKAFLVNEEQKVVYKALRASTVKAGYVEARVEDMKKELEAFKQVIAEKIAAVRDSVTVRELETGELLDLTDYIVVDMIGAPEEISEPEAVNPEAEHDAEAEAQLDADVGAGQAEEQAAEQEQAPEEQDF